MIYFSSKIPPTAEKDAFPLYNHVFVPNSCLEAYRTWFYTSQEKQQNNNRDFYWHEMSEEKEIRKRFGYD